MKDDRLVAMRVFQTVVETGGFTAAAQVLGVSQPFVSQIIQRLEERLETKLLHRTTRGHRLTPEGELYIEGCREAVAAVEAAEARLQIGGKAIRGDLRVSAPLGFGLDRIVPLLPTFLDRHPGISLDLLLTDSSLNLIEEQVDVAIRMGRLRDSTLFSRRLCGLQRIVVAAPALIDRLGRPDCPEDLERFPVLSWSSGREHLNRWSFQDGDETRVFNASGRFRSNDGMSLFNMCQAGFGIMRCAEHLARPAIRDGSLVELLEEYPSPEENAFFAVFLPDRNLLPRIRTFIDYMIDSFSDPQW